MEEAIKRSKGKKLVPGSEKKEKKKKAWFFIYSGF
jgi:hypothetical protein